MATIVGYTQVQYSGIWSLSAQANAQALGIWAVAPIPTGLWSWGTNGYGQLGLGNVTSYSSPKQIGSLTTWATISNGTYFSFAATKSDGTLWCWGNNVYGELGVGDRTNRSSPTQVGALTTWLMVSAGSYSTSAIKTDGTLWSWGYNVDGRLGLNNRTNYSSPVQVGALTNWSTVSAGHNHSIAIKTDGTLWSWGNNQYGQLGLGTSGAYANKSSPTQVGSLTNWSKVSAGLWYVLAIKTDGSLWSWGYAAGGCLGLSNQTYYSSPKQVGLLTNWKTAVAGIGNSSFAITTSNTLFGWGSNGSGQLCQGNLTYLSSPKQIGALTNWKSIGSGSANSSFTKTDGTLWACGANGDGRLGTGNLTSYSSPVQIGALTKWLTVSCSYSSVLTTQLA